MNTVKPGILTTEFWGALIAQILPLLVTIRAISAGDVATLQEALTNAIMAVGAFGAAAWVVVEYIKSRVKVKTGGTS